MSASVELNLKYSIIPWYISKLTFCAIVASLSFSFSLSFLSLSILVFRSFSTSRSAFISRSFRFVSSAFRRASVRLSHDVLVILPEMIAVEGIKVAGSLVESEFVLL